MDFLAIFFIWITIYAIGFCLTPIGLCLEWHRRGSSEGFSSVNMVIPCLMMACWMRYGFLADDTPNKIINGVCLLLFSCYLFVYDFYQPNKKYLHYQLTAAATIFITAYLYTSTFPDKQAVEKMGSICATVQTLGMGGLIYDMMRAIRLKTTEYIPAAMTFGGGLFGLQFLLLGILTGDFYVTISNLVGVVVNAMMISLYAVYPPLTWRVPIIGVGPTLKTEKKE